MPNGCVRAYLTRRRPPETPDSRLDNRRADGTLCRSQAMTPHTNNAAPPPPHGLRNFADGVSVRLLGDAPMSTTTSKAETKHTPGPWAVIDAGPTNDHKDSRICDDSGDILAVVRGRDVPDSIHIANASLIAAAPDLLAACKSVGITPAALDRMLVATPRMTAVHISLTVDQVRVIYAAIARAEGGAA